MAPDRNVSGAAGHPFARLSREGGEARVDALVALLGDDGDDEDDDLIVGGENEEAQP